MFQLWPKCSVSSKNAVQIGGTEAFCFLQRALSCERGCKDTFFATEVILHSAQTLFAHPLDLRHGLARLRTLTPADLPALIEVGREPSLWAYSLNRMQSEADLVRYLETALAELAAGKSHPFVIEHAPSGAVAGCTRFGNIALEHYRLEIGWSWIGSAYQRTGLNRAAKAALLTYAFETLSIKRVELKANALNRVSRRAMEGIGAVYEGCLRQHMTSETGVARDTVYYSILANEWPEIKVTRFGEPS
jgi:N-acetyltransferase